MRMKKIKMTALVLCASMLVVSQAAKPLTSH